MLQLIVAFFLVLFLPGFTLVNMLFPRKGELDREYDLLYRITLGLVMSIVVVVLFGFFLNELSDASMDVGYFTAPNLWIGLSALTVTFFLVGWWRGAYPALGRLHPKLARPAPLEKGSLLSDLNVDREVLDRFRELTRERERLRKQVKDAERRATLHTGSVKEHYEAKREELQKQLRKVDDALTALEEQRSEELY